MRSSRPACPSREQEVVCGNSAETRGFRASRRPGPVNLGRRRYNPAMTITTALAPASTSAFDLPGLTREDAARAAAAACDAARSPSTRTVYAHAWRQ